MDNYEIITKDEYTKITNKWSLEESVKSIVMGTALVCSFGFGAFLGGFIKNLFLHDFIIGINLFYFAGFFILGPLSFKIINYPFRFLYEKYCSRKGNQTDILMVKINIFCDEVSHLQEPTFAEITNLLTQMQFLTETTIFIKEKKKNEALDKISASGYILSDFLTKNKDFQSFALLGLSHPTDERYNTVLKSLNEFFLLRDKSFKESTGVCLYNPGDRKCKTNYLDENIDIFEGLERTLDKKEKKYRCVYIETVLELSYYNYYITHKNDITQMRYNFHRLFPILEQRANTEVDTKNIVEKLFF